MKHFLVNTLHAGLKDIGTNNIAFKCLQVDTQELEEIGPFISQSICTESKGEQKINLTKRILNQCHEETVSYIK